MKKYLSILLMTFLSILGVEAQNNSVESARVAFISQKINITSVQAEKFWPLFNELASQRLEIRKAIKSTMEKMNLTTEQTIENTKKNIDAIASLKQKEISLEKEYYQKYLLVITPKQFSDLLTAEKEFQRILVKKVSEE